MTKTQPARPTPECGRWPALAPDFRVKRIKTKNEKTDCARPSGMSNNDLEPTLIMKPIFGSTRLPRRADNKRSVAGDNERELLATIL